MSRALKSLLVMMAVAGCDGTPKQPFEPLPVPPAAPRFTIEITAPSGARPATLHRGESVVLTAVVKDQAGAIVTTGTVLWNLNVMSGPPIGTPNEKLGYVFSLEPIDSRSVRVTGHTLATAHVSGAAMGVGASFPVTVVSTQYPFIWSQEAGIQRIPTPDDAPGEALAINNRGEVVGWYGPRRDAGRAFLWSAADGFRDIHPAGDGENSVASAINEHGTVAGHAAGGNTGWEILQDVGFVYRDGRSRTFADTSVDNHEISGVYGINDDGTVVGEVTTRYPLAVKSRRAFIWTDLTGVLRLPIARGMETSRAFDVNNKGEIVGYDGEREAGLTNIQIMAPAPVVWNKKSDTPTELFTRKGSGCENGWEPLLSYDNACAAVAVGINDAGQIAGVIGERAFRRDAGQSAVMFPDATVPSTATGINSRGDISGHVLEPSELIPERVRAGFVWRADGRVVKLGTLPGAVSTYANAINDRGQVVGYVY